MTRREKSGRAMKEHEMKLQCVVLLVQKRTSCAVFFQRKNDDTTKNGLELCGSDDDCMMKGSNLIRVRNVEAYHEILLITKS